MSKMTFSVCRQTTTKLDTTAQRTVYKNVMGAFPDLQIAETQAILGITWIPDISHKRSEQKNTALIIRIVHNFTTRFCNGKVKVQSFAFFFPTLAFFNFLFFSLIQQNCLNKQDLQVTLLAPDVKHIFVLFTVQNRNLSSKGKMVLTESRLCVELWYWMAVVFFNYPTWI